VNAWRDAVDVVYVAASARDARLTRICVASLRHFYPDLPIKLLIGGPLHAGLEEELARYWDVGVAELPRGDYGWGFVKLEPLFSERDERFLVLDSDVVITGPVLALAAGRTEDLIVDDEDQTDERGREIYFDYERAPGVGDGPPAPAFLFNTGQWFGRSGRIGRDDFAGLINWGWPPRLADPSTYKNGDQGVLNLVANRRVREGTLSVGRVPLMRWPGFGLEGLTAAAIAAGEAPPLVIHWAGMKKARLQDMAGADILHYFEKLYYGRVPGGDGRRRLAGAGHVIDSWLAELRTWRRLVGRALVRRFAT
jgi:hypothetical protein